MKITVVYDKNLSLPELALIVGSAQKKVDGINNERVGFQSNSAAKVEFKWNNDAHLFSYNNVAKDEVGGLISALMKYSGAEQICIDGI